MSDARTSANPPGDDPAAIEAEIEATRARLAETVDELAVRVHPKTIAQRYAEEAKAQLQDAVYTTDGKPRVERLAAVGAAVAAFLAIVIWRKVRK